MESLCQFSGVVQAEKKNTAFKKAVVKKAMDMSPGGLDTIPKVKVEKTDPNPALGSPSFQPPLNCHKVGSSGLLYFTTPPSGHGHALLHNSAVPIAMQDMVAPGRQGCDIVQPTLVLQKL